MGAPEHISYDMRHLRNTLATSMGYGDALSDLMCKNVEYSLRGQGDAGKIGMSILQSNSLTCVAIVPPVGCPQCDPKN